MLRLRLTNTKSLSHETKKAVRMRKTECGKWGVDLGLGNRFVNISLQIRLSGGKQAKNREFTICSFKICRMLLILPLLLICFYINVSFVGSAVLDLETTTVYKGFYWFISSHAPLTL